MSIQPLFLILVGSICLSANVYCQENPKKVYYQISNSFEDGSFLQTPFYLSLFEKAYETDIKELKENKKISREDMFLFLFWDLLLNDQIEKAKHLTVHKQNSPNEALKVYKEIISIQDKILKKFYIGDDFLYIVSTKKDNRIIDIVLRRINNQIYFDIEGFSYKLTQIIVSQFHFLSEMPHPILDTEGILFAHRIPLQLLPSSSLEKYKTELCFNGEVVSFDKEKKFSNPALQSLFKDLTEAAKRMPELPEEQYTQYMSSESLDNLKTELNYQRTTAEERKELVRYCFRIPQTRLVVQSESIAFLFNENGTNNPLPYSFLTLRRQNNRWKRVNLGSSAFLEGLFYETNFQNYIQSLQSP